jgi:hypothetical protein
LFKIKTMAVAEKIPVASHVVELKRKLNIPPNLIWEVIDGKPLYRRGYKDVMKKLKTLEEIMGTSSYQSIICQYINKLLNRQLDDEKYDVMANEVGLNLKLRDNVSQDIAIYPLLSADKITKKYTNYPAKIVIEVDIDIDPSVMKDIEYMNLKTQKLLDFGTEKVIWILTNIKKVMIATPNAPWVMVEWHQDIEILEGIVFNIQAFLDKRGIDADSV